MKLFEPGSIGKLRLKNRIVMAPMGTSFARPDGRVSRQGIDYYAARARGGTGLIVTGGFRVLRASRTAKAFNYPLIDDRMFLTRLNELVDAVHDYGAKISIQLHGGQGRTAEAGDGAPPAPSAVPCSRNPAILAREMTIDEIKDMVRAFQFGAEMVREAGADCIDIHGHKGGLVDQFMTSLWNKRTDEYGGSLENRLRFAIEIIQAAKKAAGADLPVIFRYGLTHYLEGGREIDEGLEIARRLEAAGADALIIDAGCVETMYWIHPPTTLPPGCMVDMAAKVKQVVKIPVIAVGKLGYPEVAENVLQEGKADFIALGRPLLADPEWANKAREGRFEDIIPCIGDHEGCERRQQQRRYLSCSVNPATGMEKEFALKPAERKKTVLVVGGGPGGMAAARVAALRGHKVTLWEKADVLGGNLIPASAPDFKRDYRRLMDHLIAQVKKAGVTVELGKEATAETIKAFRPDAVFVATGAAQIVPAIPGVNSAKVVTAVDVLLGKKKTGERVVVIGGGVAGTEAALYLAKTGKSVNMVEVMDSVARNVFKPNNYMHLLKLLAEADVKTMTETTVLEITDAGVTVADKNNRQEILEADTVVLAVGLKSSDTLSEALVGKIPEVFTIGDCVSPRKVINAIWEGFRTARVV